MNVTYHEDSNVTASLPEYSNSSRRTCLEMLGGYWMEIMNPFPPKCILWQNIGCRCSNRSPPQALNLPLKLAPGIDGITAKQWRFILASANKALFFNVILGRCGSLPELLTTKTVLIPKNSMSAAPQDFWPIEITLVVIGHLHKILECW